MQFCICCEVCVTDPYLHAILVCPTWDMQRSLIFTILPQPVRLNRQAMYDVLCIEPHVRGFQEVVALCALVDMSANKFWAERP